MSPYKRRTERRVGKTHLDGFELLEPRPCIHDYGVDAPDLPY